MRRPETRKDRHTTENLALRFPETSALNWSDAGKHYHSLFELMEVPAGSLRTGVGMKVTLLHFTCRERSQVNSRFSFSAEMFLFTSRPHIKYANIY